MIVLDASVLIGHLDESDIHHERADEVVSEAVRARSAMMLSPLTLAEALVGPVRTGRLGRAQEMLARLEVVTVPLPDEAPARLARLRAETGLRLPDCCVLLAADQTGGAVATFDDRLARSATDRGMIAVR